MHVNAVWNAFRSGTKLISEICKRLGATGQITFFLMGGKSLSLSADRWEEGDWKWVRKLVVPFRGQNQRSGTFMNILHVKSIKLIQILCVRWSFGDLCRFKLALPSLLLMSKGEVKAAHSDFDRCPRAGGLHTKNPDRHLALIYCLDQIPDSYVKLAKSYDTLILILGSYLKICSLLI